MKTMRLPGRGWIAGLLLFVGLNAVVAGYGFVGTPDGSAVGIPLEWLEDSPFDDYLIPGIALFSMGLLAIASGILQLKRHHLAWAVSGICGSGFVIWIIVQATFMGSFRHPVQTTLQAVVLAIGIAVALLSSRQYRLWNAGRVAIAPT